MSEMTDGELASVRELIEKSELRSIECYEVSARRYDAVPLDDPQGGNGGLSITIQHRLDDDSFGIRLVGSVELKAGEASASIAGEYALLDEFHPSPRTLKMFINEVGVMTILPYFREAIATMTSRVFGEAVLLPTIQRGEITVDLDED